MIIKELKAERIYNSKREETIKLILKAETGKYEASVPKMDNPKEAIKLVDGLNKDFKNFLFQKFDDFTIVEELLKKYNVNKELTVAIEYAILKAVSRGSVWNFIDKGVKQVPRPLGDVIGGGKNTNKIIKTDFQEFLLLSTEASSYLKAVNANKIIHEYGEKVLRKLDKNFKSEVTDDGAWATNFSNLETIIILKNILRKKNEEFDFKVKFGIDVNANNLFVNGNYVYKNFSKELKERSLTRDEQIEFMINFVNDHNIIYLEDPLEENDFEGFKRIKEEIGSKCLVVGDNLIKGDVERLKKALECVNAIIIKPDEVGSLMKVKELITIAKENKIYPIISGRSVETTENILAHLAVGFACPVIKTGIYGKEREAKLDEIREIEYQIRGKNKN